MCRIVCIEAHRERTCVVLCFVSNIYIYVVVCGFARGAEYTQQNVVVTSEHKHTKQPAAQQNCCCCCCCCLLLVAWYISYWCDSRATLTQTRTASRIRTRAAGNTKKPLSTGKNARPNGHQHQRVLFVTNRATARACSAASSSV